MLLWKHPKSEAVHLFIPQVQKTKDSYISQTTAAFEIFLVCFTQQVKKKVTLSKLAEILLFKYLFDIFLFDDSRKHFL